jgi:hypothetical protein
VTLTAVMGMIKVKVVYRFDSRSCMLILSFVIIFGFIYFENLNNLTLTQQEKSSNILFG